MSVECAPSPGRVLSADWLVKPLQLSDFQYHLPAELIAQQPVPERSASRLLQLDEHGLKHGSFADVAALLQPDDILIVNNTRVIKARLYAVKDSGGQAEVLLERLLSEHEALCQVRVSKPLRRGRVLQVADRSLTCVDRQGQFYRLRSDMPLLELMEQYGEVPLPPYIERPMEPQDSERYQTVYGQVPGAVAAPTAGLHFTADLLQKIRARGTDIVEVTLHVGAGTFQPVRGALEHHEMHMEAYEIDATAAHRIENARGRGGRVVAVGTTVVRTLESAALKGRGRVVAGSGETRLFIKPGFKFQVVDALITNFHLPGSTLLMLVCAFAGYDEVMNAYRVAVEKKYRFFSYGDALWVTRREVCKESGPDQADV